ncbi:MAG: TetR/AcrR family transcriptional regulator [Limnobacter sp.]|nr:TetR/AcrR family transcriptional regulator [Limnobacter sp.]
MSSTEISSGDGRKDRGLENKKLIVEALIELIREGQISPTAEAVSDRAGVGLRTVFRHFADMETLYREIAQESEKAILKVLANPLQGECWQDKLMHAVERRSDMFERLMPIQLATLVNLHQSDFLKTQQAQGVQLQRQLLKAFLPASVVKDKILFEALDLNLSIETWLRLRRDQKLSKAKAKEVMKRCVEQLISQH